MYVKMTDLPKHLRSISRKRSVNIIVSVDGCDNANTWWDEGSKRVLSYLNLLNGRLTLIAGTNPPQFGGRVVDVPMKKGYAILDAGIFCGKPSFPILYLHPDNVEILGCELVGN